MRDIHVVVTASIRTHTPPVYNWSRSLSGV